MDWVDVMGRPGKYTGEVSPEDEPNGKGVMRYEMGLVAEGEWIKGVLNDGSGITRANAAATVAGAGMSVAPGGDERRGRRRRERRLGPRHDEHRGKQPDGPNHDGDWTAAAAVPPAAVVSPSDAAAPSSGPGGRPGRAHVLRAPAQWPTAKPRAEGSDEAAVVLPQVDIGVCTPSTVSHWSTSTTPPPQYNANVCLEYHRMSSNLIIWTSNCDVTAAQRAWPISSRAQVRVKVIMCPVPPDPLRSLRAFPRCPPPPQSQNEVHPAAKTMGNSFSCGRAFRARRRRFLGGRPPRRVAAAGAPAGLRAGVVCCGIEGGPVYPGGWFASPSQTVSPPPSVGSPATTAPPSSPPCCPVPAHRGPTSTERARDAVIRDTWWWRKNGYLSESEVPAVNCRAGSYRPPRDGRSRKQDEIPPVERGLGRLPDPGGRRVPPPGGLDEGPPHAPAGHPAHADGRGGGREGRGADPEPGQGREEGRGADPKPEQGREDGRGGTAPPPPPGGKETATATGAGTGAALRRGTAGPAGTAGPRGTAARASETAARAAAARASRTGGRQRGVDVGRVDPAHRDDRGEPRRRRGARRGDGRRHHPTAGQEREGRGTARPDGAEEGRRRRK
ncbi:hypothetical protein THAOC_05807, partial [Thalassiosira oceanica]